jgi:putative addiction module component (TIGR02574 family)
MDVQTVLAEISDLSVEERLRLIGAIWDGIEAEIDHLPLEPSLRAELERRVAADDAAPERAVPWRDVKQQALARSRSCGDK